MIEAKFRRPGKPIKLIQDDDFDSFVDQILETPRDLEDADDDDTKGNQLLLDDPEPPRLDSHGHQSASQLYGTIQKYQASDSRSSQKLTSQNEQQSFVPKIKLSDFGKLLKSNQVQTKTGN